MKLSDYNYSEYKLSFNLGNRKIEYRPWTTKDEKEYLMFVNEENDDGTEKTPQEIEEQIHNILIKPALKNKDMILSLEEKRALTVEMRKISVGDTITIPVICSNESCKSVNHHEIDIDEIYEFKPFESSEIEIDNIKFKFGDVRTENLMNRVQDEDNLVQKNYLNLLVHITNIEIGGKDIKFKFDELQDFIDSLPTSLYSQLEKEFYRIKSTFVLNNITTKCIMCSEETEIMFSDGIPNFLWG